MDTYSFYRLDSLIFTCFTYSKGLKYLTLLIIETYTLTWYVLKISQFIKYIPSNIIYTSFNFFYSTYI